MKNDIFPVFYIDDKQTLKNKIESNICKIPELVFFRWYHGLNEQVIGLWVPQIRTFCVILHTWKSL